MKNLLAVLGIVLLSAVSASAAPAEKPAEVQAEKGAEKPAEAPVTPPATAPDQAPAPQGVACGPLQQTPLLTAGGSTCAMARTALDGVLASSAGCGCGYCSKQTVYKQCVVVHGGYQVSGYMKYSCTLCPLG